MDAIDVRNEVKRIRHCSGDPEAAHSLEDDLYLDILKQISSGDDKNAEIAAEAIKTQELEFPRWCA